jgi:hypothetical protein
MSPNERTWTFLPLNEASLKRCVPWMMSLLDDDVYRPWTVYRRWVTASTRTWVFSGAQWAALETQASLPNMTHGSHKKCPASGLYSLDLTLFQHYVRPPPPLRGGTYGDASSKGTQRLRTFVRSWTN